MSNIDEFNKALYNYNKIATCVNRALGNDREDNDKHRVSCSFSNLENAGWHDMILRVHVSHGYYGNSSGTSDTSVELGKFLAKAINADLPMLLNVAVGLARADCDRARVAAEEEAKAALNFCAADRKAYNNE